MLLPPQMELVDKYINHEVDALEDCVRMRRESKETTMDAKVAGVLHALEKVVEDTRTNFEAMSGRLDDLEHSLAEGKLREPDVTRLPSRQ